VSELTVEPAGVPRARQMLQRAAWATRTYANYDVAAVRRIVTAVASVAESKAEHYAAWAVRETGFGVVEHKVLKNRLCSRGLVDAYQAHDYVTPRVDEAQKVVEVPRPAGVIFALTPSTNPVSTVYFKVLLALMTRNAIVLSPHPYAKECCADAVHVLHVAAVEAGAPDGIIQVAEEPSIPLINALMSDPGTNVILATGGVPVVRAAYSSGNPAFGVGPGNVPVLVDATADLPNAAKRLVDSKSFDNSVLCTSESVAIVEEQVADRFLRELERQGAHVCSGDETTRLRDVVFMDGHFNTDMVGRAALDIAKRADVRCSPRTRVLVAPLDFAVPEEPLAHEKLCTVLGLVRVPTAARGIRTAAAVLRIGGAGHSAVIHSNDPKTVMAYAAAVPVLRVTVNAGGSTGSSGFDTNLAPSMTIGTGFVGRSSLGENLEPKHLVNWARIAYNSDPAEVMPSFAGLAPGHSPVGPVPAYPVASNLVGAPQPAAGIAAAASDVDLREEIRRLVVEELATIIRSRGHG